MNIKELNTETLWAMLSDLAEILSKHSRDNSALVTYWYVLYTDIQKELDSRMITGGVENE